ncbi:cysteine hydrolase family protein [uncultured Streptococcus sp.]|uniref:cysteine hydrolase family protein n=1 Tax=uncultured Streptococcus sp. TaxID=83427 RepID=UPI00258EB019|nr:isochorismatase family cysteine hydrolase [uncultured Streptococcus sp.]
MTKALISIDYSYDFVADDGKLTAGKPAQAIEDRIAQVTQEAYDNGDYIFVAMDRHDEGDTFHPETKLFPPHNIAGTAGRELYGKLAGVYDAIKDDHRVFWMDKRHYSAFSGTDLDIRLRERRDAYNLGYDIEVVESATASLTTEAHDFAIGHFKNVLGATIVE